MSQIGSAIFRPIFAGVIMLEMVTPLGAARAGADDVLYAFQSGSDGDVPYAGLVADKEGNFYGTTMFGGRGCTADDCGVIFELSATGTETVLYSFTGKSGTTPTSGLIIDKKGDLYGVTGNGGSKGGAATGSPPGGKFAPDGTETVLYSFCAIAGCTDGATPYAPLVADGAGNLYGTTTAGGAGYGTVFKLAPDGTETVIYAFQAESDGSYPEAGVVLDGDGNLYGTTALGLANDGAVFKISPSGQETTLHEFTGGTDGEHPFGGVILDKAGRLYGTTGYGGDPKCVSNGVGCGTIFEIHK